MLVSEMAVLCSRRVKNCDRPTIEHVQRSCARCMESTWVEPASCLMMDTSDVILLCLECSAGSIEAMRAGRAWRVDVGGGMSWIFVDEDAEDRSAVFERTFRTTWPYVSVTRKRIIPAGKEH